MREIYHSRHRSLRHLYDLSRLLGGDGDGSVRAWIHEEIAGSMKNRVDDASRIASLRASIIGVSPVLLAACLDEGLPIADVAHALLPFAAWPPMHEGWPSIEEGEPFVAGTLATSSALSSYWERDRAVDGFMHRNRYDGAVVRGLEHRRGGWAASVHRGILGTEIHRGGARLRTVHDRGTITLAAELPRTIASAVAGRPVSAIVDDPALRNPVLVMTSARVEAGSATIRFRCPPVAADFGALTDEPCELRSVCDVVLQAEHAILDLLADELRLAGEDPPQTALHRSLVERIRTHEPSSYPGGPRLDPPSVEWVAEALRHASRPSRTVPVASRYG